MKNDIEFKSSLNKKSLPEASRVRAVALFTSSENSKVKYRVGPRDSRSSISRRRARQKRETLRVDEEEEEKEEATRERFCLSDDPFR